MPSIIALFSVIVPSFIFFALLAAQIYGGLEYWSWDQSILNYFHENSQENLDRLASILTNFGTTWGVLPGTVLLYGVFSVNLQWRKTYYILTTMVGALLISYYFKLFFHRPRPHFWPSLFPLPSDYAFPSGHALLSLSFSLALITLAWYTRWRWAIVVLGFTFAIAIAWTRLYLGVHYPSDILAGWLLAIAWVTGISALFNLPKQLMVTDASQVPSQLPPV